MNEEKISQIKAWLMEAAENIRSNINRPLSISQKSNRTDLVTNLDEETQQFLINKIKSNYPEDRILAEEKEYSEINTWDGNIWVIDPIDGTLNFVFEKENFCIMIAYYQDGIGQLGFIHNVMKDELFWGGRSLGVYCNEQPLNKAKNRTLAEGLIGMNAYMYGENIYKCKAIGQMSMGIRVNGCAGLEISALLKGAHIGYLSNLSPWDYAAGIVLLKELGFNYGSLSNDTLHFSKREYFFAATPKAFREIKKLIKD